MTEIKNYKLTKYACYYTYLSSSSIFGLPPVLFVTFREMYGISYTLLGTLVLINFCTQLLIDLIFSFFSKYFNIRNTVRIMPLITSLGMLIYALVPTFFPQYAYIGLALGTVIFSVSAGLGEVLLSPLIAAIPSDTPDKDMSLLHSLYAYGLVSVVIISTLYLKIFGTENWMYLTLFFAVLPIVSFILYSIAPIPEMNISHNDSGSKAKKKTTGIILFMICIFLGSAAENTMTNWVSGFMEKALKMPKTAADLLGLASFAILLALGRTLYAKKGKNISNVLLLGMIGAVACYLVAGLSTNVMVSMIACILTGFCTSMLWPGTLIMMEENFLDPGVSAYALMAAGGDFGASVAPQMLGIVVDKVAASDLALRLGERLYLNPEQIGMKSGMLIASIFPILGFFLLIYIKKKYYKKG
ncbi:MAG: MFS transporter [Clostridia bacterium]|nr:MFS transporter [Clostridia bacterium]